MFNLKGKTLAFLTALLLISQVNISAQESNNSNLNDIGKTESSTIEINSTDTNQYKMSNVTINNDNVTEASMMSITVDTGSLHIEPSPLYNINYDILDNHKTAVIIFKGENGKVSAEKVQEILDNNVTYTLKDGQEQNVTIRVSNNEAKIPSDAAISMRDEKGVLHYYMHVKNKNEKGEEVPISWDKAYDLAKTYRLDGLKGYLVTITSKAEDDVLKSISKDGAWSCGSRLTIDKYDADTVKIDKTRKRKYQNSFQF